mmetsp:Transcript_78843/g.254698  ORF Transcript_78843/g.254698 Transcript_78843/m.254698 type:complete len:123 (-) Transcript_78843:501-869(-)
MTQMGAAEPWGLPRKALRPMASSYLDQVRNWSGLVARWLSRLSSASSAMHEQSELDAEPCASVPTKEEKSWKENGLMKNFLDTTVLKERSVGVRRSFVRRTSRTLRWPDLRVCGPVGMQFVS